MEEMLEYCSKITGCEEQVVEKVVDAFLDKIVEELAQGRAVDLGSEFGIFSTNFTFALLKGCIRIAA